MTSCFVRGCCNSSDSSKVPGLTFHRIPYNEFTTQWLHAIGRKSNANILKKHICSEHFKETDFEQIGSVKKVKPDAVPTLNLGKTGNDMLLELTRIIGHAKESPINIKKCIDTLNKPVKIKDGTTQKTREKMYITPHSNRLPQSIVSLPKINLQTIVHSQSSHILKNPQINLPSPVRKHTPHFSNSKIPSKVRRYSVRAWNNHYVCSRKQNNVIARARKAKDCLGWELKGIMNDVKIISKDVKKIAEKVEHLKNIVTFIS